jgi:hypothetical protein
LEPCYAFVIPRKDPKSISPIEINGEKNYDVEKIIDLRIWNTSFIGKVTM